MFNVWVHRYVSVLDTMFEINDKVDGHRNDKFS